jgi:hypothetical protein
MSWRFLPVFCGCEARCVAGAEKMKCRGIFRGHSARAIGCHQHLDNSCGAPGMGKSSGLMDWIPGCELGRTSSEGLGWLPFFHSCFRYIIQEYIKVSCFLKNIVFVFRDL